MPLSNAQMRDVNSVLHPYTNLVKFRETGPMVIERGQGVRVYDENGKDYIEAMAGLWCTALGWGENELAETAAEQMKKLSFGHLFGGKRLVLDALRNHEHFAAEHMDTAIAKIDA